jgi:hypothetical protein
MAAERDHLLIGELAGCGGLPGDINGMDGIEAGDSSGPTEMMGHNQVGLLKVAHFTSRDIGIGRSARSTLDPDLLCLAGPGQDLLDGRDCREPTYSSSLKLEMDRFGADTGEGGALCSIDGQFVAHGQDNPAKDSGVRLGIFLGTRLWSRSPSSPNFRYRRSHLASQNPLRWTVWMISINPIPFR